MASSILSSRCSLSPAAAVARALGPPRMTLDCRFQSSVPMPLGSMAVRSVASRNSSLSGVAPGKHCRSCNRLPVLGRRRCKRGDYAYHQLAENLCGSVKRFVDHVLYNPLVYIFIINNSWLYSVCLLFIHVTLLIICQKANATVSMVHSYTKNPEQITSQADIIVSAAGVANLVRGSWIKPGAVVIDVGINPVDVRVFLLSMFSY
ncbi:hypothetical protein B296_00031467 [Ensete ventricosum]|uniref:methenyltetrahydrofolate cyclohydrolase n=1 Tax=Ensete ventricosum TaxID=4639 RepID=A0A427ACW3_ENSVE|nr:hypothetical protein B296_00031467 [Ensete ventricosum]